MMSSLLIMAPKEQSHFNYAPMLMSLEQLGADYNTKQNDTQVSETTNGKYSSYSLQESTGREIISETICISKHGV